MKLEMFAWHPPLPHSWVTCAMKAPAGTASVATRRPWSTHTLAPCLGAPSSTDRTTPTTLTTTTPTDLLDTGMFSHMSPALQYSFWHSTRLHSSDGPGGS